ncbi:MAG TPA: hydroxyacid dehydrogenase [Solirubrobacteraceae bacterium]|nr:hydroxyacid dehydrogenase [Solirubrobacteraceae bacterium]
MILVDPQPRTLAMICDAPTLARLEALGPLVVHEDGRMPDAMVDEHLAEAVAIVGQTAMPAARLERAPKLRAIVNVEGNFLPNVDYEAALARGVHVLNASPAFALPVAEMALGMAIDLARGISAADRAMRDRTETYGLDGNAAAFLISASPVGIVGYGDLGRELHRLLAPFHCPVKVYDPWVPDLLIERAGAQPLSLDDVLASSKVIFVFAAVTAENEGFLGRAQLERIRPGSVLLLMSRAGVVDFDALVELVGAGRFAAATDVFPDEPVAPDDPVRGLDGMLLSPHRAGGMREAFLEIGRLVAADLELVLRGLPPQACKRAERETAGRLRSRPVDRS